MVSPHQRPQAIRLIGLTGGIATGKSAVSQMLRELGAEIIDADELAREVVQPGSPALAEIAARFPWAMGPDGRLDRAKLGERIFVDAAERVALNAIVHPRIQQLFRERVKQLADRGAQMAVYDAPLLIENGLHREMSGVILVTAPIEAQIARLTARNGLSRGQAVARLSSQLPLAEKLPHATWVIDNSGDLASTRAQVERAWKSLRP